MTLYLHYRNLYHLHVNLYVPATNPDMLHTSMFLIEKGDVTLPNTDEPVPSPTVPTLESKTFVQL